MIVSHALLLWTVRREIASGSPDFRIFYAAGLILRRGQGENLYNDRLQQQVQREFASAAIVRGGPLPYNHPPFEAAIYVALSYLSYVSAYFVWFFLNLIFLAASVFYLRPWIPMLERTFPRLLFWAPLAFFPVAYALMQGQDSILLLLLYCMAYDALRRNEDMGAGAYMGLGLFKFHLVLPFAFILLVRRRWRALGGLVLAAVLEMLLSLTIVGWKELVYYPGYAWHINRQQAPGVIVPRNMPNLRGLLTGWSILTSVPMWIQLLLVAISVGLLMWASRHWQPSDMSNTRRWDAGFSLALVATFLVGFHSYSQDMSILLLPWALTIDRLLDGAAKSAGALKIAVSLMFFSPLYVLLAFPLAHLNLFALVLLWFAGCLAGSEKIERPALVDRTTGQSNDLPR